MKNAVIAILVLTGVYGAAQSGTKAGVSATADSSTKPAVSPQPVDPAKEAAIRQLMQLTGSDKLADQMMVTMEANLKPGLIKAFPPGEYREQLVTLFFEKVRSKAKVEVAEMIIPIYDKYFSYDEIREMIGFYQTPIGKKTITVMPQLLGEVMQAAQSWSQQLGKESLQEVLQEHPDLKQAMEEAEKKSNAQ